MREITTTWIPVPRRSQQFIRGRKCNYSSSLLNNLYRSCLDLPQPAITDLKDGISLGNTHAREFEKQQNSAKTTGANFGAFPRTVMSLGYLCYDQTTSEHHLYR